MDKREDTRQGRGTFLALGCAGERENVGSYSRGTGAACWCLGGRMFALGLGPSWFTECWCGLEPVDGNYLAW